MTTSTLLNRKQESAGSSDDFQSPPWILDALTAYLPRDGRVWEPACGNGNLVRGLLARGYDCIGTDILTGHDFLKDPPPAQFGAILTNPPYSRPNKELFLGRCYELGKPFALLLPFTALEGKVRQALYRRYGVELVCFHERVQFETPSKEGSGAWFPCAWFCGFMGIGRGVTFWEPDTAQSALEFAA